MGNLCISANDGLCKAGPLGGKQIVVITDVLKNGTGTVCFLLFSANYFAC